MDQKQSFSDSKAILCVSEARVNSLGVLPESHTGFSKARRRDIWESGICPCQRDTEEEANKKFQSDTYLFSNCAVSGSFDFLRFF